MDSLHLTYDEVVNKIPYRNLIIMQRDKQHEVYGDVVKKISGKELANRRKK
jgi:conserved domain protein